MSDGTGEIIGNGDNLGGKPAVAASAGGTGGTEGRNREPEIIHGYDAESPDTERIYTSGGARRTKSGKIDGRTLRGRRGTTAGTTFEPAQEQVHIGRVSLEDAISTTNIFLGGILAEFLHLDASQQKVLEVDKDENKALADAIAEYARLYAVTFDPKKVALFNLVVAFGSVYGTRGYALYNMRKSTPIIQQTQASPSPPQQTQPIKPGGKSNGRFSPSEIFGDQGGGL